MLTKIFSEDSDEVTYGALEGGEKNYSNYSVFSEGEYNQARSFTGCGGGSDLNAYGLSHRKAKEKARGSAFMSYHIKWTKSTSKMCIVIFERVEI